MQQAGGGAGFGLSAHEIYQQVTGGPGPGSLDAAYEATRLEFELEGQRAQEIVRLAEEIKQGWQGDASDAAHGATAPMADSARERSDHLLRAQMALESQGETFRHTVNSVVPVPPDSPEGNIFNDMIPWETDLDAEIKEYQNNAQHNLVAYRGYDTQSMNNELMMPRDYPSTTDWSGNISVSESGSPSGGRPPSGGEFQPRSSSLSPDGGPDSGSAPNSVNEPNPASERPQQPPGVSQPPLGTDPSDTTQPPGTPPGTRPPIVPPVNQPPVGGLPPVGGWPPGTVAPPGGRPPGSGPDGGRGSGSGGPFGRGGGGGSEGGPGGRAGAPGGPGARGGAVGEPGTGGRPGAGAGALSAEEAARRGGPGAAGARGGGGAGGFAPVGAGRPAGREDEEHQRKYMIEPDPEDMFGTDEKTAPPVIGVEED